MVFRSRWGHVLAVAVLGFALVCSTAQAQITFSSPKNVSNNTDFSFTPQVAVDSAGHIYVVWEDDTNTNSNILFSLSTDSGANFSTPLKISNTTGDSFNPHIMVDSQNHINVVWEDDTPGPRDVFFSHSTDGGLTFSAPVNLSNDSADSSSAQVAADSTGNVFVVWENDNTSSFGIMFSRSLDGGATFSAPVFVSTNTGGSMASQIAVDAAGNINVVWEDTISSSSQIAFARSQNHGATFSAPKTLSTSGNSNSPQIALDGGNINVVWVNDSPGNFDVFYTRSTDGQNFSSLLNLSNNNPGSAATPQVATDLGGNISVIWSENSTIFFAHSSNAGSLFSLPKNVSSSVGASINPSLAVDSGGNINLAWQVTAGNRDIFFSRSTDSGATFFATPQNLSQNTGMSSVPQIVVDKNGSLNVVWQDNTGGVSQILFSRFTNAVVNHPPTANAGADQTLQATDQNGVSVTLDGSKSSDPDLGDTLTYSWTDQNNTVVGTTAVVQLTLLPGTYPFTLKVTDSGTPALSSTATTHVTVKPPPVADAGPNQTVQATGQSGASVTLNGTKSSGDGLTYVWTDQNNKVVGTTAVVQLTLLPGSYTFTLTVTDSGNLTSSATTNVTVNAPAPVNHPPVANAGVSQTLGCTGQNGTYVTLNGSASSDPDGDSLTFVWRDASGNIVGTAAVARLTLPSGVYSFTLTVTDPGGLSSSASTQVTIQDATPPDLSVSLSPNSLQPPNHKLIPITATISASDACSANVAVSLDSITSNEPDNGTGDGDQPNDIQAIGSGPVPFGTDVRSFLLRAERAGGGNGRIYTVTYSATDAAGNSTSTVAYVVVGATLPDPPPDKKRRGRGYSGRHDNRGRDKGHDNNKDHDKDKDDKDRKGDH